MTLQSGAQSSVSNNTELGRGDATISVNGQRTTSNSVRINGIDANSIGTNSTPNIAVPATDSLQEFVVQTSLYDASNGRNSGGNVEAITRGGGNNFRGNAYYFFRNKALNANQPFINKIENVIIYTEKMILFLINLCISIKYSKKFIIVVTYQKTLIIS